MWRFLVASALALAFSPALLAQPPQLVAPTGPLAPADERKALVVPEGFEVQLVAAEPDIQKPIQMAFDAKGRLWVTTSYHYPFAGPKGKSTDKLFVLSDFGPDGKARTVRTFADTLNIPIGILPLPDCNSCIVSSVGEILKLTDTDGDGKADKTEVLFTGFGSRDTHGMYNSFTYMPDGWVYACHGFSNDSTVKGKDGHEVKMQSGHTFRFRPDGSRIEVFTRGQVNPFGMAVDPWFNLYTADCHSKPITQLIPGAFYQSFGKPHDGLGFAPHVTTHDHGSTALCGLTWYAAGQFPKEYQGCLFLGNVVTNRINFDRIEWKGGTPVAHELPDFLVSKDPWFRPADIKLGPDGALYVTDFYNKIIGHYEVDLHHPGRDKARGRVWRIVWKGKDGKAEPPKTPFADLTKETAAQLVDRLGSPNLTVRLLATNELIRREKGPLFADLAGLWAKLPKDDPRQGLLFAIAHRHGEIISGDANWLKPEAGILNSPAGELIAVQVLHAMSAGSRWDDRARGATIPLLASKSPHVQRAAIEAAAAHPHPDFVKPLVELLKALPPEDNHQRYAARIALRNQFREDGPGYSQAILDLANDQRATDIVAEVLLAVPKESAARLLASYIERQPNVASLPAIAEHIGRHGDPQSQKMVLRVVGEMLDTTTPSELAIRMKSLRELLRGTQAAGKVIASRDISWFQFLTFDRIGEKRLKDTAAALAFADTLALLPKVAESADRQNVERYTILNLSKMMRSQAIPEEAREAAAVGLGRIAPTRVIEAIVPLLNDPKTPSGFRERLLIALASVPSREARGEVNVAVKGVPYRVAVAVALNMATSKIGGEELLASVKAGFMPARVLQEKTVLERLRAANLPDLDKQVADLTKGLQPADQKLAQLIKQRTTRFAAAKTDKELGAKLFTKHCAACHRIAEQGGKVGPQLDGIGARGLERLLEDTLDPNRNVDAAFRARVLNLADGTTKTGLMLRVEGEVLVLADNEGKEVRVPTKDIESNRETALSPMPANFGEAIPEAEFFHLVAYLLDQRAKDPPKK